MDTIARFLISRFPALSRLFLPSLLAIRRYRTLEDAYYRHCVDVALSQAGMYGKKLSRKLHELPYRFIAEQIFFEHARIDTLRRTPITIRKRESAEAAIRSAQGRGVIFGCSNFGCFYFAVLGLSGIVDDLLVVSDRPPADIQALCEKAGAIAGIRVRSVRADAGAGLPLLRQLKRGGAVAVMLDSYYGETTELTVPFMGRPATASAGVYAIATLCSALLLPLALIRTGRSYAMELGQPVEAAAVGMQGACREVNAFFETCIRTHPDQWMSWPNLLARWELAAGIDDTPSPLEHAPA